MLKVLCVGLVLLIAAPASAQSPVFDDPEARLAVDVLPDVMLLAPTKGPAWWKVTKGSSTVWILGWPPTMTPKIFSWDKSVLQRRLKGARVLLAPPNGFANFSGDWVEALPPELAARARKAGGRSGVVFSKAAVTGLSIVKLTGFHQQAERLDFHVAPEIEYLASKAKVPVVRPKRMTAELKPGDWSVANPAVLACMSAMLDDVETDRRRYVQSANYWAVGQVTQAIDAVPRGSDSLCGNVLVPGFSRRLIEVQTAAITDALQVPGKALAVAPLRQLLAEEGILVRLRAAGFTVSDPVQASEE